jgi:hypothetical protein
LKITNLIKETNLRIAIKMTVRIPKEKKIKEGI